MAEVVNYLCKRCGNRFLATILTEQELQQERRNHRPVVPLQCPRCGSAGVALQRL